MSHELICYELKEGIGGIDIFEVKCEEQEKSDDI